MTEPERNEHRGVWAWLGEEKNRKILTWMGSGAVAIVSGLWVVYQGLEKGAGSGNGPVAEDEAGGNVTIISDHGVAGAGPVVIHGGFNSAAPPSTSE